MQEGTQRSAKGTWTSKNTTSTTWGGARVGAGRKAKSGRRSTPHRARPLHWAAHPVHVTLRSKWRSLRKQQVFPTLVGAIADQRRREKSFRIVHFSVQYDHLHLIVEARNKRALSSGMRGLVISIARRVNKLLSERGRFWADRYHARALTTPRAVRTALRYVLANFRKHEPRTSRPLLTDAFSSAPWFEGFRECRAGPPLERARFAIPWRRFVVSDAPVSAAQAWLTLVGWRKMGLLSAREAPSSADRRALK